MPAARYARRAIALFLPSILPSWSFLRHPILPFSLLPFPVILSNLDPFAHLSLCSSRGIPFFLSLQVLRFQGNVTLNNVPRTRLYPLYMHVSLLSNKWIYVGAADAIATLKQRWPCLRGYQRR